MIGARTERYPDLLVRITGFNARFVDLAPVEQDELIQRAEVGMGWNYSGPPVGI